MSRLSSVNIVLMTVAKSGTADSACFFADSREDSLEMAGDALLPAVGRSGGSAVMWIMLRGNAATVLVLSPFDGRGKQSMRFLRCCSSERTTIAFEFDVSGSNRVVTCCRIFIELAFAGARHRLPTADCRKARLGFSNDKKHAFVWERLLLRLVVSRWQLNDRRQATRINLMPSSTFMAVTAAEDYDRPSASAFGFHDASLDFLPVRSTR